jgi:hypothetical protein
MSAKAEARRLLARAQGRGLAEPKLRDDAGPARLVLVLRAVPVRGTFCIVPVWHWYGAPEAVHAAQVREARDEFILALSTGESEDATVERCRKVAASRPPIPNDGIEPGRQECLSLIEADPERAARRLSAGLWPLCPARGVYADRPADGGCLRLLGRRDDCDFCRAIEREEADRARREREELAAAGRPVPSDPITMADDVLARWP